MRKHRAEIIGDTISGTAASVFGAATSNVGSAAAKATGAAGQAARDAEAGSYGVWDWVTGQANQVWRKVEGVVPGRAAHREL